MKNLFLLNFLILFLTSCNNKADEPVTDDDSSTTVESNYVWQAILNDTSGNLEMSKVVMEGADNSSPETILNPINQIYPEIKVDYLNTSNDTVFLKIDDAHFLTQQMGSAGASMYLAGLIYNITELKGIQYVNISFPEGDHAQPGTYTRRNFINE